MTDWVTGNKIQTSVFKSAIPTGSEFWAKQLAKTPYAQLAVTTLRSGRLNPNPTTDDDGGDIASGAVVEAVVESKGDVKKTEVKESKRGEVKPEPSAPPPPAEEEYIEEEDLAFPPDPMAAFHPFYPSSPVPSRVMAQAPLYAVQGSLPGMMGLPPVVPLSPILDIPPEVNARWRRSEKNGRLSSQ